MKKHPNSPHLSIRRLTILAQSFTKENWKEIAKEMDTSDRADQMHFLAMFIAHVEKNRASLSGRPKKAV